MKLNFKLSYSWKYNGWNYWKKYIESKKYKGDATCDLGTIAHYKTLHDPRESVHCSKADGLQLY